MVALKSTFPLFALILASFFFTLTCSRQFSHHRTSSAFGSASITKRAPEAKKKNDLPCRPWKDGKAPEFPVLKDPAANDPKIKQDTQKAFENLKKSGGKPKKDEKPKKDGRPKKDEKSKKKKDKPKQDKSKRDISPEHDNVNVTESESISEAVAKRANDDFYLMYQSAMVKVRTDSSGGITYNRRGRPIKEQVIATRDLSGCTILVVASPYASIMVHVWERAAPDGWTNINGPAQREKDLEFVAQGRTLLRRMLRACGGSVRNGFNGCFPQHLTQVHIVAPAANPDYDSPRYIGTTNPRHTLSRSNPRRLYYPWATDSLRVMACAEVIPDRRHSLQSRIHTYMKRFPGDPRHRTDDTEFTILRPSDLTNGELWLVMFYDHDQAYPIVRMA
ncbi:hypothetical protein AJ79_06065 [Helicocarpus griseus UAMH5409]|uniref:Uncharacterized protein n=1 Tax=Helicocarpus griseus UAMH5409 TaxID=1447875 RepID=A0A2B7XFY6_9EURO|nr:hypothetical protein AJ79_06065 [Helicocarpus griseus UAMH5409]